MGSFYSQCSISGINIPDNDEVVRILLLPRWHISTRKRFAKEGNEWELYENTKGLKVSNDVPWGTYIPFAMPLKGYYRDYGQVRDFTNTKNVKQIEDFFGGVPIDIAMECAEDERWIEYLEDTSDDIVGFNLNEHLDNAYNVDILKELAFTDIRKDVYDKLVDMFEDEVGRYWFSYRYDTPEEWLDVFKRRKEVKEQIRENLLQGDKWSDLSEEEKQDYVEASIALRGMKEEAKGFIPRYTWFDFLEKLKYDESFSEEYKEFAKFHLIISRMNIWIQNSNYGTQERNHELYIDFYETLLENLKAEHKEYEEKYGSYE